jgi:hypothetical protein
MTDHQANDFDTLMIHGGAVEVSNGRIRNHPFATVSLIGLAVGLIAFSVPDPSGAATFWTWAGMAGTFLCVGAPISWYVRQASRAIDVALQPVPSPEQIRLQFIQTLGREPTVQEVAALHQMLTSRHSYDLLNAGIMVGGAVLGTRSLNGKGLL